MEYEELEAKVWHLEHENEALKAELVKYEDWSITDKDREFLEKSKLGNIVYSKDALRQQLDIEERVARGLAQKWNTRFDQIPDSAKGPTGVTKIELTKSIVESLNPQDREAYDWATKNPSDPRASQIRRRLGL
jgi:hypothetical protein